MPHESFIGVVIRLYAENQPPEWPGSAKFLVGVLIVILVILIRVILVTNENKVNPRFCLRLLLGFDNNTFYFQGTSIGKYIKRVCGQFVRVYLSY